MLHNYHVSETSNLRDRCELEKHAEGSRGLPERECTGQYGKEKGEATIKVEEVAGSPEGMPEVIQEGNMKGGCKNWENSGAGRRACRRRYKQPHKHKPFSTIKIKKSILKNSIFLMQGDPRKPQKATETPGSAKDALGGPREPLEEPKRPQENPIRLRKPQEAPGDLRRPQKDPGSPGKLQNAPGCPRRPKEVPLERPRKP